MCSHVPPARPRHAHPTPIFPPFYFILPERFLCAGASPIQQQESRCAARADPHRGSCTLARCAGGSAGRATFPGTIDVPGHEQTHTSEKPYACSMCPKSVRTTVLFGDGAPQERHVIGDGQNNPDIKSLEGLSTGAGVWGSGGGGGGGKLVPKTYQPCTRQIAPGQHSIFISVIKFHLRFSKQAARRCPARTEPHGLEARRMLVLQHVRTT